MTDEQMKWFNVSAFIFPIYVSTNEFAFAALTGIRIHRTSGFQNLLNSSGNFRSRSRIRKRGLMPSSPIDIEALRACCITQGETLSSNVLMNTCPAGTETMPIWKADWNRRVSLSWRRSMTACLGQAYPYAVLILSAELKLLRLFSRYGSRIEGRATALKTSAESVVKKPKGVPI